MEVLLSALPPQTQVQSVPVSAAATQTRPQLPPELANLPKGTLIEGFVVNRDAQGNPILRTSGGDVLVKSELFLKTGSEVLIRLGGSTPAQGGQSSARIVSVDQQPVAQLLQQQQSAAKAPHGAATRETLSTPNAPLQAVLVKPASYGSEAQSQQNIASILRLPPNVQNTITKGLPLQFQIASAPAMPASSAPSSTAAAPAPTSTPTSAPVKPNAAMHYSAYQKSAPAPVTSPQTASPSASSPAAQPAPASTPAASAPPPTLTATVIGHEGNETVVRTSIGTIKLFTPAPLPTGSQVPLIYVPDAAMTQNTASTPPSANLPPPATVLAGALPHDWEALREAMQLLSGNPSGAPQAGAAEMASRIPNTKSELVNSVLFFLSALRASDMQRWLGASNTQKIDGKSPSLLARLSRDFAALGSLSAADKPDMPWQMLAFPLLHEDSLNQARLFWRHEQTQADARKEDETRFIFDLELSELGALQIDGLVHGKRPQCRCDLVIRSEKPLEESDKQELGVLYSNASEAAGIAGQLRFASGKDNLLAPLQEMRSAAAGGDDGSIMV